MLGRWRYAILVSQNLFALDENPILILLIKEVHPGKYILVALYSSKA